MIVDRVIIERSSISAYRDQGYRIAHCKIPGKFLAVFWVPIDG